MLESLDIENDEKYKSMKDKNIQKLKKCIEKIDEMIAKKLEGESKATESGSSICMKLASNIEEIHKFAKQIKSNNIEDENENDILFIQNFLWAGLRAMKDALTEICRPELIVTPSEYYLSNFYYMPTDLTTLPSDNIEKMSNPEDLFSAIETLVSSMQDNYLSNNNQLDEGDDISPPPLPPPPSQPLSKQHTTTVITSSSSSSSKSRVVKSSYVKTEETVTEIKEEEEQSKEESKDEKEEKEEKEEEDDEKDKEEGEESEKEKKDEKEEEKDDNDKSIPSVEALTSSPIPNDTSNLNDTINSETNQLDNIPINTITNNNTLTSSSSSHQLIPSLSSDLIILSQLVERLHEVFITQIQEQDNATSTPRTTTTTGSVGVGVGGAVSVPSLAGSEVIMDKSFVSSSSTPSSSIGRNNNRNNNNNVIIPNDRSYVIPSNNNFQTHYYHTYHEQKELHGELVEYKKKLENTDKRINGLSDKVIDMHQRINNTKQKQSEGKMHLDKLIETYNILSMEIEGLAPPFNEISDAYDHTKNDLEELRKNSEKIDELEKKYSDILSKYNDMNSKYKELNDRYNLQKQLYQTIKGQLQYVYPAVQQTLCMPEPSSPLPLANYNSDEDKSIIDSRSMKELEQFKHELSQFIENTQKQYDLLMQCKKPYGILWRYVTNNYQISIGKIHGLCDSLMNSVINAIDNNNNEDIFGDIDEEDYDTKLLGNTSISETPGNTENTANTHNTDNTTNTESPAGANTSTAIAAQTRAERLNSLKFYLDVLLNGIEQLSDTDSGNIYVGDLMERSFNILFNNAVDYENVIMKLKADFDALKLKSSENEKKAIQLQKLLEQYGYLK